MGPALDTASSPKAENLHDLMSAVIGEGDLRTGAPGAGSPGSGSGHSVCMEE